MTRLLIFAVLLTSALIFTNAQLTFTPGWGKRSDGQFRGPSGNIQVSHGDPRIPMDSIDSLVFLIYRIIQEEAQKLVDCNQK
ncbi:Adipokinetic hormone [Sergentomyia squamirostris]